MLKKTPSQRQIVVLSRFFFVLCTPVSGREFLVACFFWSFASCFWSFALCFWVLRHVFGRFAVLTSKK